MKRFSLFFIGAFLLFLNGCMQSSNSSIETSSIIPEGVPVCGELDGEKQTFPSIEELSNIAGASYLHDGPCYE